jgi:hypothetical protein
MDRGVAAIRSMLQSEDRLALIKFGNSARLVSAADRITFASPDPREHAALFDSIVAALLEPSTPGRRRVLIVLTNGFDSISFAGYPVRRAVVDRSNATVVIVRIAGDRVSSLGGLHWLGNSDERTHYNAMVDELARRSGGLAIERAPGSDYTATLRHVLTDLRSRYLVHYQPIGTQTRGWHALDVRVTSGRYDVAHRLGYWVR